MKNKNVYILNEYFNREFHSNLILGILSASKGANVYIGTDQDFKFLLKRITPQGFSLDKRTFSILESCVPFKLTINAFFFI